MLTRRLAKAVATVGIGLLSASFSVRAEEPEARSKVDFDRQIRPILSNNCFRCHGPDAGERQAELRLDVRDEALQPAESGKPAIVPGKPDESTLVARIFAAKSGVVMPPPKSQKHLSAAEKALLRRWVEQGAGYDQHWSFVAPKPRLVPEADPSGHARNEIDRFIQARLQAEHLRPSPEADKVTLIRRLTLDLTGLPPTLVEVDAFLADRGSNAYSALVDRLLNSPHFGERLAVDWLDAARFADTHGYHIDSGRDMTLWRKWVIDAFNQNLPFDRFTVEQLAGDLLPEASVSQRVASGFNRNHMINFEGGAIPEEYQTAYVIDRVNTTGTVWMGLTVGCVQCHDHKFDPITQKDYYQLYAFFNNLPENGLDGRKGNAEPMLKVPTVEQAAERTRIELAISEAQRELDGANPALDASQDEWEKQLSASSSVVWETLNPLAMNSKGGATLVQRDDGSIVAEGVNPSTDRYSIKLRSGPKRIAAIRLEALPEAGLSGNGPGRSVNGNVVLTEFRVDALTPVKIASASADFSQEGFPVAQAIDGQPSTGWAIFPEVGKPHSAVFAFDQPLTEADSTPITVTLEFQSPFGQHQLGRFRLSATSSPWQVHEPASIPKKFAAILAITPEKRNESQHLEIRRFFRTQVSSQLKPLNDRLTAATKELAALDNAIPTAMVMNEMAQPRDTFLLMRGQYDKHGEKVGAGVPAFLPPLPKGAPANRLGLALWLVDPSHPLMSRVIVNRYWQMLFGTGLVRTAEDFGAQGEAPSHPELLDWLALEFQKKWDVKALIRQIVTSSTYRQAAVATADGLARDPENRLLARGPRLRLQAEFIRDQALAISGLLDDRIGGASVSPYQPPGLWEELASRQDGKNWSAQSYDQSHGRDLYRRTMYTFWKRTSPPPTLATFDAPDRETCTVRRSRTNTPLQALVLLNDPTYVEASRKLAERIMKEGGATTEARIAFAFRLAVARQPSAQEAVILSELFEQQRAVYRNDHAGAVKLLAVGEAGRDASLDAAELAAWSMVAATILNLDETITKG